MSSENLIKIWHTV